MGSEYPLKSFRLREFILEAGKSQPSLVSSQFPARVPVYDRAVVCDREGLSEGEVSSLSEGRQFVRRNRQVMPNITWMRMKLVYSTGHDLWRRFNWPLFQLTG